MTDVGLVGVRVCSLAMGKSLNWRLWETKHMPLRLKGLTFAEHAKNCR